MGKKVTILNLRVKGSSTIEVVVAVIIFSLTLTSSLWIYTQVYVSSLTEKQVIAKARLQSWMHQTIDEQLFEDETFWEADLQVSKTVTRVEGEAALYIIQLESKDENGKVLATIRQLHYEP